MEIAAMHRITCPRLHLLARSARLFVMRLEDRTQPSVALAYVDDIWTGTAVGAHPILDPVGGLVFGADAFSDIPSAISNLNVGGTLVIFGGTYTGSLNINKALAPIQIATNALTPAQALVK